MERRLLALDELARRRTGAADSEPDGCRLLVALGHPFAGAYAEARAFYERLRWHGPAGRVVALLDRDNRVELTRPALLIAAPPGDVAFAVWAEHLANDAFLPVARPGVMLGQWTFTVNDRSAAEALRRSFGSRGIEWRAIDGQFTRRCLDLGHFRTVRAVVEESLDTWNLDGLQPAPRPTLPHRSASASRRNPPAGRVAVGEQRDLFGP